MVEGLGFSLSIPTLNSLKKDFDNLNVNSKVARWRVAQKIGNDFKTVLSKKIDSLNYSGPKGMLWASHNTPLSLKGTIHFTTKSQIGEIDILMYRSSQDQPDPLWIEFGTKPHPQDGSNGRPNPIWKKVPGGHPGTDGTFFFSRAIDEYEGSQKLEDAAKEGLKALNLKERTV